MLKSISVTVACAILTLSFASSARSQSNSETGDSRFPRQVKYMGVLKDPHGQPRTGVLGVTLSIYTQQEGGSALWMETQNVECDANGHFTVFLGATTSEGLPPHIFNENEARWLGVWAQLPDEVEQARVPLTSVLYALKSADSDQLGGRPASDYLLRENANAGSGSNGSMSSRILWPGGAITGVLAGPGLTGGGNFGTVTLGLDTAYTDARYPRLAGPNLLSDLAVSGNLTVTGRLNDSFYVGTTGGLVTPPAWGPAIGIEATDGGNIQNGTYYFKVTLVNLNGETTPSPATPITLTNCQSTGCVLFIVVRGLEWRTGAFGYRVYGSVDGTNFFLQSARPIRRSIGAGSVQRAGNLVTVNFGLRTTGFTVGDTVSITGSSGCSISPDGQFKLAHTKGSVSPQAASFQYQQQGPDETCGNGTASVRTDFDLGSMTNVHLVRGDFLLEDILPVGSQPPATNGATIDDVQVAVNSACSYANNRCDGAVVLDNGNDPPGAANSVYKLTTPLILSSGVAIRGQSSPDVPLALLQGTQVWCRPADNPLWGNENVGCVMVINALGIRWAGINIVSESHGVMLFHSNTDAAAGNDLEFRESTFHTRGTSSAAPIRIKGRFYYVKFDRLTLVANTTVDSAPVRGAAVMISNPAGGNWHWTGPIRWMIPNKHDGVQNRKGPTDPDRGANLLGFPGMATVYLHDIQMQFTGGGGTGVPCRCENVNLKLDNVNWADYRPDPGTGGLIQLGMDADGRGSGFAIEIDDSGLGGHPNAAATIQVTENGLSGGLVQITNSGIFGSGASSVAIDANNSHLKLSINGGGGVDCSPDATRHVVANMPSTVHNNLSCVNSGNMSTTESRRTQHIFMGGILFRGHKATSLEWLHWQDNTDNLDWWRGSPGFWPNRRATFGQGFTRLYQSDGKTPLADFNHVANQVNLFSVQPVVSGGVLGSPALRWAGTFSAIDLNGRLTSTLPTGTPPLVVSSITEVANLNAQKWHGRDAIDFSQSLDFGSISPLTCAELTISVPGALQGSSIAPGWPALDIGLVGLMAVSPQGTISVRLCNLTSQPNDPPSHVFGGRVIN